MKFLRRRVVSRLLVFVIVLALLLGVAYTGMIEHHFIYFPLRELEADPSSLGLPFDEVYFVTQDGVRLHGWFVPGESGLTGWATGKRGLAELSLNFIGGSGMRSEYRNSLKSITPRRAG